MNCCCQDTLKPDVVRTIEKITGIDGEKNKLVYILAIDSDDKVSIVGPDGVIFEPLKLPTDRTQITSVQCASFGSYTGSRYHWVCIDGEKVRITHPNHPL